MAEKLRFYVFGAREREGLGFLPYVGYQRYVRPQRSVRPISVFEKVKLKISRGRKIQLVVSCEVVITPCCGLAASFVIPFRI